MTKTDMKKSIILITFLLLIIARAACFAQEEKDKLKVLLVGNSYTHFENLPQIISIMSDSSTTKLITKKSTAGGAKFREHWLGEKGLKTKEMIKNGDFDIVILQEYSMGAINEPDSLIKYAKLLCNYIKAYDAKPYFYLTWAREKVPQYQTIINKVYAEAATANDAVLVPVGKAWALARHLRPNIELYNPDGSHPSKLGVFLTACVFVATILNEMPNEIAWRYSIKDIYGESIKLMAIDYLDVTFCKRITEEIVLE